MPCSDAKGQHQKNHRTNRQKIERSYHRHVSKGDQSSDGCLLRVVEHVSKWRGSLSCVVAPIFALGSSPSQNVPELPKLTAFTLKQPGTSLRVISILWWNQFTYHPTPSLAPSLPLSSKRLILFSPYSGGLVVNAPLVSFSFVGICVGYLHSRRLCRLNRLFAKQSGSEKRGGGGGSMSRNVVTTCWWSGEGGGTVQPTWTRDEHVVGKRKLARNAILSSFSLIGEETSLVISI